MILVKDLPFSLTNTVQKESQETCSVGAVLVLILVLPAVPCSRSILII
jgi:hypothetical protein